jgi:hypothetical protein
VSRPRRTAGARVGGHTELVVLGAHATAMWRRLCAVEELLASGSASASVGSVSVTLLVAPRPVDGSHPRVADGSVDELLTVDGRFPAVAGWRSPIALHPRPRTLAEVVPTEAHLALVLLARRWGVDVVDALTTLSASDDATSVELELPRPRGFPAARISVRRCGTMTAPSTEGTLDDWARARGIEARRPSEDVGRAGTRSRVVVTSHPHALRTRVTLARIVARRAAAVDVAAGAGPRPLPLRTVTGETRSLLREIRALITSRAGRTP